MKKDVNQIVREAIAKKPDMRLVLAGIAVVFLLIGGVMYAVSKVKNDTVPVPDPAPDYEIHVAANTTTIGVGETTEVSLVLGDDAADNEEEIRWESSSPTVAKVNASGKVTGVAEGSARIIGSVGGNQADVEITVTASAPNPDPNPVAFTAAGFEPVPLEDIVELPESIYCEETASKKTVQGVEWNTDTMETIYVCYAWYIVAYDRNGHIQTESNRLDDEYLLFGIDYYQDKLFCVFRSSSFGKFKLRIYDADTLELLNSTDLNDLHHAYSEDKKEYGSDPIPSIDGITVAPTIGNADGVKIYVSYNVYYNDDGSIGLNEDQELFEYDYDDAVSNGEEIRASRRLKVSLGGAKFGIQTLEYDRSTGNIWCAVRQGTGDYSLYCIDGDSTGKTLELISNGGAYGWDCTQAGDGLCSLGNGWFSVLIPTYYDDGTCVEVRQVSLEDLEDIE